MHARRQPIRLARKLEKTDCELTCQLRQASSSTVLSTPVRTPYSTVKPTLLSVLIQLNKYIPFASVLQGIANAP